MERVYAMKRVPHNLGNMLMIGMVALIVVSLVAMVLATVGDRTSTTPHEDAVGDPVVTTTVTTADTPISINKDLPVCRYARKIGGTTREQLDVFIPTTVGYYHVNLLHSVYKTANYDIWRLNKMAAVDDSLNKRYDITNTGEFEAAIRLQGRSDFSGGSQHGDEMMTAVEFYIDGTLTDITSITDYRTFSEMKIVRDSIFYDAADHTTQIATHRTEYIVNKSDVRIQQKVVWSVDAVCDISYLAMFPILRTTTDANGKTVAISKQYTDDKTTQAYDVLEAGKKEYPQQFKQGVRKITLTSDDLGLASSLELMDITNTPGAGYSHCSAAKQYNKLYFTVTDYGNGKNYPVKAGATWEATTHYAVSITK